MSNDLTPMILAAGCGKRFGMPKYRAEINGKTFIEHITGKLKGCGFKRIICVKQNSYDIPSGELMLVDNPFPEKGMISSIYYGFKAFHRSVGYLLFPVDYPLVSESVIEAVKSAFFREDAGKIIRPVYKGAAGHPIAIPAGLLSGLDKPDYKGGLREFIRHSGVEKLDIAVNDENILRNINKPEDLVVW